MTTDRAKRYAANRISDRAKRLIWRFQGRDGIVAHIQTLSMPPLGDKSKRYPVELTEPEINAIHAAGAFVKSACEQAGFTRFWEHYGPTLEALSERLGQFDD